MVPWGNFDSEFIEQTFKPSSETENWESDNLQLLYETGVILFWHKQTM